MNSVVRKDVRYSVQKKRDKRHAGKGVGYGKTEQPAREQIKRRSVFQILGTHQNSYPFCTVNQLQR